MTKTEEKVLELVEQKMGTKIKKDANLIDEGADSLDAVEIIMELEDEFGIEIKDEDAKKLTTVQKMADFIVKQGDDDKPKPPSYFVKEFNALTADVTQTAEEHGFGENVNDGEKIALMHSELSEALESLRKGDPADDKIPEFTGAEAELADTVIRIMHFGYMKKLRIAEAIEAKAKFNKTRPHMHGGKLF